MSTELSVALQRCLLGAKSGADMNLMGAREVTTNLLPYICFLSFGSSSSDLFFYYRFLLCLNWISYLIFPRSWNWSLVSNSCDGKNFLWSLYWLSFKRSFANVIREWYPPLKFLPSFFVHGDCYALLKFLMII